MNTTITLGDAGIILIGLAVLVLIIYLIFFVKNLIITLKNVNKILEDTQIVSGIAAENAQEVHKVLGDVSSSVGTIADVIKGNQNIVSALTSIVNALASAKNIFGNMKTTD